MDKNDIFLFIKKYFIHTFEIPEKKINLKSSLFEDLELDSIDALDMVGMLESEMDIETNEKELKTITTVQDVVDYIIVKTAKQNNTNMNSQTAV